MADSATKPIGLSPPGLSVRDSRISLRSSGLLAPLMLGVMRGQKRVEDARERAYHPRIHLLREKVLHEGWIAGNDEVLALRPLHTMISC